MKLVQGMEHCDLGSRTHKKLWVIPRVYLDSDMSVSQGREELTWTRTYSHDCENLLLTKQLLVFVVNKKHGQESR